MKEKWSVILRKDVSPQWQPEQKCKFPSHQMGEKLNLPLLAQRLWRAVGFAQLMGLTCHRPWVHQLHSWEYAPRGLWRVCNWRGRYKNVHFILLFLLTHWFIHSFLMWQLENFKWLVAHVVSSWDSASPHQCGVGRVDSRGRPHRSEATAGSPAGSTLPPDAPSFPR